MPFIGNNFTGLVSVRGAAVLFGWEVAGFGFGMPVSTDIGLCDGVLALLSPDWPRLRLFTPRGAALWRQLGAELPAMRQFPVPDLPLNA